MTDSATPDTATSDPATPDPATPDPATSDPAIPSSIDDIDASWLSSATGFAIDAIEVEQIGIGIGVSSAVYRVRCTGSDCPATVVVKLPALAEEAVFTSTMLRMYIREVNFFDRVAEESPIRVPKGYYGAVDEETSQFVQVMEDMGDMRMIDQLEGMDIDDARRAIDELAAWHATYWGRGDELAAEGTTVSIGDPIYPAVLPLVFGEGWEKVTAAMEVEDVILDIGPKWTATLPWFLEQLGEGPTTMFHGDYRGDNIMFGPNNEVVLLDFQLIGSGCASYDLAYFVTQSLDGDVAGAHEQELFDRWIDGLKAGGVPEADLANLWEKYRIATYFCLVYPIVASRGMDLDDPRQRRLVELMNSRSARAFTDLDVAEFAVG